jgi:hypothetical protein
MKKHYTAGLLALAILIGSCKKDDNSADSSKLQGNYTFKGISAKTSSTVVSEDGDKVITTSEYNTTDNKGTIVWGGSTLSSQGLSYTINSTLKYSEYSDDELVDSFSMPFSYSLPATNSAATYKLIGADSIYFTSGFLTSDADLSGATDITPSGGRYSLSGNQLTITQRASRDSTFEDSGITYVMTETVTGSILLEKQ